MKEAKQALQIAIDYMNDRLEDHDCKYQRHPATEAERINILADIETVKEALAKQEQDEPVEWGVDWGKDGNSVSIIKRLADGNIEVLAWEYAPHPQQRTWVGLTVEEIADCCRESTTTQLSFYNAIEAKLKEKNT